MANVAVKIYILCSEFFIMKILKSYFIAPDKALFLSPKVLLFSMKTYVMGTH